MKYMKTDYFLVCLLWTKLVAYCEGHSHHNENSKSAVALQQLLRVLGLERNNTDSKSAPPPPQYMLDLYRTFSEGQESDHHTRHPSANTIRSFFEKGVSNDDHRYLFEIAEDTFAYEEIVAAEFHYFFDRRTYTVHPSSHIIQVLLYEEDKNQSKNLLEARLINTYSPGWEVFKVTSTVKKWRQNPNSNQGFVVETLDFSGRISNARSRSFLTSNRPILIVFSLDKRRLKSSRPNTHPKSIRLPSVPSLLDEGLTSEETYLNEIGSRSTRSARNREMGHCARHEMRVDFEKLGWSSWIISPKYYDAFVCSGVCAFPLGQHQRPTNHATVQSIVHELGLTTGIEAPCCVPTELHSLSLLYFDEHMNVVLKQYEEMVAVGCGCQ